jgi:SulP family sulfate permease
MKLKLSATLFNASREGLSGIITGTVAITVSVSMAALIFHGNLSNLIGYGIGTVLCATITINLILLIGSSNKGIVAAPQSATSIVLAAGIGLLYDKSLQGDNQQDLFLLITSYLFLTSIITGIFLFIAGKYNLGKLARFVPYPVIGGFLAGTGYLIIKAAVSFMIGFTITFDNLPLLISSQGLIKLLPGIIIALMMFFLSKTTRHLILVPLIILCSICLFYSGLWVLDVSHETALKLGIVMQINTGEYFNLLNISNIIPKLDYSIIFEHKWTIFSIIFITSIALLLNLSSLELIIKNDIDLDKELKLCGTGNIVSGLFGGIVGYQMLGPSALNHALGLKSRIPTIVLIVMSSLILFFGHDFLNFFPVPLIGAYLLFIGLNFLQDFLYDSWVKLPLSEYIIVLCILMITVFKGLLSAIAFGTIAAIFIFILNYAKVKNIKSITTGEHHRSNVERSPIEEELLRHEGKRICVYRLNGYLFFGSVYNLYLNVKRYMQGTVNDHAGYIILDFKDVQGMDSSAIHSFLKISQIVENGHQAKLIYSQLKPELQNLFIKGSVLNGKADTNIYDDLDRSLEWCEEQILNENGLKPGKSDQFSAVLEEIFKNKNEIIQFKNYLTRKFFKSNSTLIKKGEYSETLYFIESGQFSVLRDDHRKSSIRYRKIGSGAIIGEMGFFSKSNRTASVITDQDSYVYELNLMNMKKMEKDCSKIAFKFQNYVIKLLSMRLSRSTQEINSLLIDYKNV